MLRKLIVVAFFTLFIVGCQTTNPYYYPKVTINEKESCDYSLTFLKTCKEMHVSPKGVWWVDTETVVLNVEDGVVEINAWTHIILPNLEIQSGYYGQKIQINKNDSAFKHVELLVAKTSWEEALKK